jgi:hypothetical protein
MGKIQDVGYEILNVLEFNRQSFYCHSKPISAGKSILFYCLSHDSVNVDKGFCLSVQGSASQLFVATQLEG